MAYWPCPAPLLFHQPQMPISASSIRRCVEAVSVCVQVHVLCGGARGEQAEGGDFHLEHCITRVGRARPKAAALNTYSNVTPRRVFDTAPAPKGWAREGRSPPRALLKGPIHVVLRDRIDRVRSIHQLDVRIECCYKNPPYAADSATINGTL